MASIRRVFTSFSLSSSPPSNTAPPRRQEAAGRYLPEEMLQKFLEEKFPDHPRKDFHIKVYNDLLAFDAPEEVTESMPGLTQAGATETLQDGPTSHMPYTNPDVYSLIPYPEDYWTRANDRKCYTTDPSNVFVTLIDVNSHNDAEVHILESLAELPMHVSNSDSSTTKSDLRVISISQMSSWEPLNVNRQVFQGLINITGASSEILEHSLAFCEMAEIEEAFSSAPVLRYDNCSIEVTYVLKYPFYKPAKGGKGPWYIRQTAVYQKYNTETNQSTWIFFNPCPPMKCAFQQRLMTLLRSSSNVSTLRCHPLLIHNIFWGTFFPTWRDYLTHYGGIVHAAAQITMTELLEGELRVNHELLNRIRHAEARCLALAPIFKSFQRNLKTMHDFNDTLAKRNVIEKSDTHGMKELLFNYSNMADAYTQQGEFLKCRTSCLAASITDTFSFKDTEIAQKQNRYMLELTRSTVDDSTTVRVITIVTLIYLPATFMATLLGMNSFFEMDPNNHNLVVSQQFWIYIVFSVPLTAATLLYWWYSKNAQQRAKANINIERGWYRNFERGSLYDNVS